MNTSYQETRDIANKLEEYATAESSSTSISEVVLGVCHVSGYPDYVSDEFRTALIKEMKRMLQFYQDNARIVTSTSTYTEEYTELEWDD